MLMNIRLSSCLRFLGLFWVSLLLLFNSLSRGMYLSYITGIAPGELFHNYADYSDPNTEDYVVIVSIMKGEGRYVDEWVRHHQSIGVDKIIIYDDTPKGEPGAALPVVQPYVDQGFVEIHDATRWDGKEAFLGSNIKVKAVARGDVMTQFFFDKQQKMQIDEWHRFKAELNSNRHIWIGNVDIDEFYNPKQNKTLKQILKQARLNHARSVKVGKLEFGPNGHEMEPKQGQVRTNYLLREHTADKATGFALVSAITGMGSRCVHVYVTNSIILDAIRGSHECNNWYGEEFGGQVKYGVYYSPADELGLNHYQTKSVDECLKREARPKPDGHVVSRHCLDPKYNLCDDTILKYLSKEEYDGDRDVCTTSQGQILEASESVRKRLIEEGREHKYRTDLNLCGGSINTKGSCFVAE